MDGKTEHYYRVLNLEPAATQEEVTQAYRDLIRIWDPQRFANSPRLEMMAEEKLKEVIEAYRALVPPASAEPAAPAAKPGEGTTPGSAAPAGAPASQAYPDPFASPRPFFAAGVTEAPAEPPLTSAPPSVLLPVKGPEQPAPATQPQNQPGAASLIRMPRAREAPGSTGGDGRSAATRAPGAAVPRPEVAGAEVAAAPVSAWERLIAKREMRFAAAGAGAFVLLGSALLLYDALGNPPVKPKITPPGLYSAEVSNAISSELPAPRAPRAPRPAATEREAVHAPMPAGTELMEPAGRAGAGKLRISNRSGQDAVARLASQAAPETPLRLVYIQPGTDATIGNIGLGVYLVTFSLGPVPASGRPHSFGPPHGPFQFLQIESVNGTQSDEYQIVLKP